MPAHLRTTTDLTAFYEKAPQDMSRYELGELEKVLREKEIEEQMRLERGSDAESDDDFSDSEINFEDKAALM